MKKQSNANWLDSDDLLRSVTQTLLARKWMIIGIALLTFALTAVATMLTAPTYQSAAAILVKKERFDAPVTPEQTIATGHPDMHLTEEEINSEVEILNSPSLHEEVIKRLRLQQAFEKQSSNVVLAFLGSETTDAKRSALAKALAKFQESLSIDPVKKSNIIRISYKANEALLAAQVVETLCAVYQERHVKLRQNDGATDFFTAQAKTMREKLDAKESELKALSVLPNTQLLNQQIETQLRQRNDYEVALHSTRTAIAESVARIQSLTQHFDAEPERLQSEERIAHRSAPDAIRSQLFALELRRSELLSKYKPDHRLIKDLDKDLEKARRMVEQVEKAPAESMVTATLNPLRQRLNETLTTERSTLASLREKEKALAGVLAQANAKVNDLGTRGYEQRRLDRERELADQAYQLYAKKGEESRVSTALDKQGIINVKVAEAARIPFKPISPNVIFNLAVGLIGGLILGLLATFTLEFFAPHNKAAQPVGLVSNFPRAASRIGNVR